MKRHNVMRVGCLGLLLFWLSAFLANRVVDFILGK